MRRLASAVLPLALGAALLVGCSSTQGPDAGAGADTGDAAETVTGPGAEPTASVDPDLDPGVDAGADPSELAECTGIAFEAGAEIAGPQLGACLTAAMVAAGSGTHRVDEDTGRSSLVHFQWTPEFSMSVEGDAPIVVRGDTGWVDMGPAGWVQADPGSSDGQVVLATAIVEASTAFADPRVIGGVLGQSDWRVIGEAPVPATDAVAESAWHLEAIAPVPFGPVSISDYQLWLRGDYLAAYASATGTFGGITATTTNTYLQWGEPVEIPEPAQP